MRYLRQTLVALILTIFFSTSLIAKEINVPFHAQHTPVWCWAATIAMVSEYVTGNPADDCDVLSAYDRALNGAGQCCNYPQSCLRTGGIHEMKNIMGRLYGMSGYHHVRPLSYSELKREIDNDRPFIAALRTQQSGHVVVVTGYSSPNNVILLDPLSGRHVTPYSTLIANFQLGYWMETLTVDKTTPPSVQATQRYCCDGFGNRRCTVPNHLSLGAQCFCPTQGVGRTCN